ncbi:MAG: glycoside hydrolase family 3 N-terminal domain-containing protein, partial [Balneolaceae bacterium]|nr:glycoside hydrolase family 3 N-terminal domain-containing protein [Balneolaceae bacterium]
GRISGTFGEDAEVAAELGAAYINGFQGDSLSPSSVATMTKHFPGGGPQEEGWDPHFRNGKNQVYPGDNFGYHLIPFRSAIEAGTAQMMPYYGVPVGQTQEEVAFAFNREIIGGLLQDSLGYDGIVCTDWGLINTIELFGIDFIEPKDYGVEELSPAEKIAKALEAGVDQFGGESSPEPLVRLVEQEKIPESRLDRSVRKLLALKYRLGLFDDPYVDVENASRIAGTDEAVRLGYESQLRSHVLLTNRVSGVGGEGDNILPLARGTRIYLHNMDSAAAAEHGTVVGTPEEADVAILKLDPPYQPGLGTIAGMEIFHQGRLTYTEEELEQVMEIVRQKPTVISIYMERPAVIPQLADSAAALLATFGTTDRATFDILFGRFNPTGRLPFEMPSSMEAVRNQHEDVPFDSENPLFPYGHGLNYDTLER